MSSPHAVLVTFGSHGDLHPFLGLGVELKRRGWRVTLATNRLYEEDAARHGLDFEPIGERQDFDKFVKNPDAWHPRRGAKVVFSAFAEGAEITHTKLTKMATSATVFVGNTLSAGLRILTETTAVRTVTIHLQPTAFRSMTHPPRMPGVPPIDRLPLVIRKKIMPHFWGGADRYVFDPLMQPISDYRRSLGLEPVTGYLGNWLHSPQRVLAMWPDWFAPPPSDWPEQVRLCGFGLYDERESAAFPGDLDIWLRQGTPPIAFTPGSAMLFGKRFFATATETCRRLGKRGILLTRHDDQVPADLPDGVRHVAFAPFSQILPRCAAVVHHGGIGSMSQGFAAGIPQVVMPMAHDQPDNARRLTGLGVGGALVPRKFSPRRLTKLLGRLMADPAVAKRCGELRVRLATNDGLSRAADEVEAVAQQSLPVPP